MTIEPLTSENAPLPKAEFRLNIRANESGHAMLAGNSAFGLFVLCGSASARTSRPGFVSRALAAHHSDLKRPDRQALRLVEAGLWQPIKGGWLMVPVKCGMGRGRLFRIVFAREPLPRELRELVMERDGRACVICDAVSDLTLDHIHPWSKGGPNTYENLRVLCRSCNSRKNDK